MSILTPKEVNEIADQREAEREESILVYVRDFEEYRNEDMGLRRK